MLSSDERERSWQETEDYYRERLIEVELLERAIYIDSGDIAVPVGISGAAALRRLANEGEAKSVVAQLQVAPGFPNPGRGFRAVEDTPVFGRVMEQLCGPLWRMDGENVRDYGGLGHFVLWGDDQPLEADDEIRGRFFGFTDSAIKKWNDNAIPGWQAHSGEDELVFTAAPMLCIA